MNDILQVMKWLREGKKVRRMNWIPGAYLALDNKRILNDKKEPVKFDYICSIEATDWEIFEEKKESKVLRIEIAKMWNGKLELRTGDLLGSSTCSNITKKEVLSVISDQIGDIYEQLNKRGDE